MNKAQLDLILARLAEDSPDTAKTYSAEVFADWLTKYQFESDLQTACLDALLSGERKVGLSPTGRLPSQPELQHLPSAMGVTPERAKELLDQYRDTLPPSYGFRNFPCVHVDLASGVDYSVEQRPIQADHASVDDKGTFSAKGPSQNLPKWNAVQDNRTRPAHYGKSNPFDILQDLRATVQRQQEIAALSQSQIAELMKTEWVHVLNGVAHSFSPTYKAPTDAAALIIGVFDNGVLRIEELHRGEKAVTLAREYLFRLVPPEFDQ